MTLRAFITVIGAAAILAAGGCGSKQEQEPTVTRPQGNSVSANIVQVSEAEWPVIFTAIGTVRNRVTTQVSSRVMAYVREVRVHTGDRVQAGQRLIVMDGRDFETRERQAQAAREEARTATAEADQAIRAAQVNLDLAETTFRRMDDLHNKKSLSDQEFDEASAKVRVARANLEMAQARRKQIDAKIAQAEEAIKAAEIQVGDTVLTAPVTGIVTVRNVEAGNLAVPGTPLLTIEQEGMYELEAPVEEASLTKVRAGQSVDVQLDFLGRKVQGRVREVVPSVDAASRSFIVKVALPDIAQLRTGLSARADFRFGSRKTLVVPAAAVVARGQMQWVFTEDQGLARARIVTLGERRGDSVEVLSGIAAGERIISPAPAGLTDGSRLETRP